MTKLTQNTISFLTLVLEIMKSPQGNLTHQGVSNDIKSIKRVPERGRIQNGRQNRQNNLL